MDDVKDLSTLVEEIMPAVVQVVTETGQGTGFFLREDGLIITNKHVVGSDVFVRIKTYDDKEFSAQVFSGDTGQDYAFLYTNAPVGRILHFVDSSNVRIAEKVIAIGHPFGYSFTVSEGIISSIARKNVIPGLHSIGFLQLDLGINPGNSGGPLLRLNGDVIGMNTLAVLDASSIAFSIPSNYLIEALENIKSISKEDLVRNGYCHICGKLNREDLKYCDKCGTEIIKEKRPAGFADVSKPPVFADGNNNMKGPTVQCRSCAVINSSLEKYCQKCGSILPDMIGKKTEPKAAKEGAVTCEACGTENKNSTYCTKCGHKL